MNTNKGACMYTAAKLDKISSVKARNALFCVMCVNYYMKFPLNEVSIERDYTVGS